MDRLSPRAEILSLADSVNEGPHAGLLITGVRREILFWLLNFVFWALVVLCYSVMTRVTSSQPELADLLDLRQLMIQRSACGFLITTGLRYGYRFMWRKRYSMVKILVFAAAASFVISLIETLVFVRLIAVMRAFPLEAVGGMFILRMVLLGIWSIVYFGFYLLEDYYALRIREVRAEKAVLQSEMKRMQAQMNPHFLFNALNAVLASRHDPDEVEEITHSLAEYLRFSLQDARPLEPLARELGSLEKYLIVQQIRFGDGLVCGIECETAAREVLVPPMLVQPLLENAFNYGVGAEDQVLRVRVTARCSDARTIVVVSNTGSWIPHESGKSPGIGIRNLRHRLDLLFSGNASMNVSEVGGTVVVTIDMPLIRESDDFTKAIEPYRRS
jgi:hypothetical protein